MSRYLAPFMAFVLFACGDEDPTNPHRLDAPIPASLSAYARHPNLVGELPFDAKFVAYRGEGEEGWSQIEGEGGIFDFEIRHDRYALWTACTSTAGEGVQRILYLAANDTHAPSFRCFSDPTTLDLDRLDVAIGDTPSGFGVGVAVGGANPPNHAEVVGAIVTLPIYVPNAGDYDVATVLVPHDGTPGQLRVQRNVRIEGARRMDVTFDGHVSVSTATATNIQPDARIDTFYTTGNNTTVPLMRRDSSRFAVAPDDVRDPADIHLVRTTRSGGVSGQEQSSWSYRVDPREAAHETAAPIREVVLEGNGASGGVVVLPPLADEQLVVVLAILPDVAFEVVATRGWLDGASRIEIDPPSFDVTWRFGSTNDDYHVVLVALGSNMATKDLLDREMFHPRTGDPRSRDGDDIVTRDNISSGRLPSED